MHVGFTGTQKGMTPAQILRLDSELFKIRHQHPNKDLWFHHGDCIGADEESHTIAIANGYLIHIHPPCKTDKQAHCKGYDKISEPYEYLTRNDHIVIVSSIIFATPAEAVEQKRSGTWYTIRRAQKDARKSLYIILPDGSIT